MIPETNYEDLVPTKYYDFQVTAKDSNSWALPDLPTPSPKSRYVKARERNPKNVDIPSDPESIDDHLELELSPEEKQKMIMENTWPRKRLPSDSDIDEQAHDDFKIKDPVDIDADCEDY